MNIEAATLPDGVRHFRGSKPLGFMPDRPMRNGWPATHAELVLHPGAWKPAFYQRMLDAVKMLQGGYSEDDVKQEHGGIVLRTIVALREARYQSQVNDLIQLIVNGIIRQEGMPSRYKNPCNLRGAPWLKDPVIVNDFWAPESRAIGIAGGAHLVALHIAQGNTLRDFIAGHPGVYAGFAPGADHNKPDTYIKDLMEWCKILDPDVPLWNLIEAGGPNAPVNA